jgi:hypothetical protein
MKRLGVSNVPKCWGMGTATIMIMGSIYGRSVGSALLVAGSQACWILASPKMLPLLGL